MLPLTSPSPRTGLTTQSPRRRTLVQDICDHSGHVQVASLGTPLAPESVLHHAYALLGLLPQWQRQCFGVPGWRVYISEAPLAESCAHEVATLPDPLPAQHRLGGLFSVRAGAVLTHEALREHPLTLFHEVAHGLDLVLSLVLDVRKEPGGKHVACSRARSFAPVYEQCHADESLRPYARSSSAQLFAEGLALATYDRPALERVTALCAYLDDLAARAQEALALL